jgi:hypothetical protein
MNKKYLALAGRIREELVELQRVVERVQAGWERSKQSGDDFYLDGVALSLHSFYSVMEKIFELIATTIDQNKPDGENWHQALLRQMAAEIKLVRPPVISSESRNSLDEYRGFRHIVRNVYAFHLSPAKMEPLVINLPEIFERMEEEIGEFLSFLETRSRNNTGKKK